MIDFEKTSIIYIFSKYDRNFIINLIDSIDDDDIGNNELSSFTYNIKEALKAEIGKNYESSSDYFITAYEIIKDKIPYSEKTEAKKFFENKISKMQYNHALSYYNDKDYSEATELFKKYLDSEYLTYDIKKDCKYKLVWSLYYYGKDRYENEYYYDAKDNFEEALKVLNDNWQIKNKYGSSINNLKKELGKAYWEIAKIKWSNYDIN